MAIPERIKALRFSRTSAFTRFPFLGTTLEALTLFLFTSFFIFYGLVPVFGGAGLGLVGADEPRYAQVAREMLTRHDYITPILNGKPWLEKPALYYWRAMFSFREFGIHDWSARLPSASFAFILVTLIYLHIRRFRPGGQLDAALLTVSCAAVLSFARGASTDMQLAAPFCIGLLGWYAWYETGSKFWLFDLYFFVGAATLAKGPVAPFLALVILITFAALRKEWSILRRSIWWPGIVLYLAMVLPWFIAVQKRNPNFLRVFFFEHNLERFATNRFEHEQHFWYYIPALILGLMPWAVIAIAALADAVRESIAEWRARRSKYHYMGHTRAGDAFPEFLLLWAIVPIIFFSFSASKLPGYILPSIPPITILSGDYLNRMRERGLKPWLLILHALVAGCLTSLVLLLPRLIHAGSAPMPRSALVAAATTGFAASVFILITVARFGLQRLRIATMIPVVILVFFLFGIGPFFGFAKVTSTKGTIQLIDLTYSARPLSNILDKIAPSGSTVAVYRVRRDLEYGVSFYRDHKVINYEQEGVPAQQHILLVRESYIEDLRQKLKGRQYEPLFVYPAQNIVVYQVAAQHESPNNP